MRQSRTFWRLFASFAGLLAITLGLLGWLLVRRMEAHSLELTRANLETKARLALKLISAAKEAGLQEEIKQIAGLTGARVTLIDASGKVLADSAENPERMDNHRNRPEIEQALAEGIGVETRYSRTTQETFMYLALRADETSQVFRLALPLTAVARELAWLQGVVWTIVATTLVLALGICFFLARRNSLPLTLLGEHARNVSQGELHAEVAGSMEGEYRVLAQAITDMGQACASQVAQMDQDRQQLRAILSGMVEGVLVIDGQQRVQFLNESATQLLDLPAPSTPGQKLWQMVRHRQLLDMVDQVFASPQPIRGEIEWNFVERKVLAVQGSRLGIPARGAVFVFHDVSNLRKLERVRQDFVANVSHELKTPLAAIQATVETLIDGAIRDPEHNIHFLERIQENADRLNRLVQDLLSLGRIESGQETLNVQTLPLAEEIQACLFRHEPRAAAKKLLLEQIPPSEPVAVRADEEALAEILDNLVDNAIKYTPAEGRVRIRWFGQENQAVLQVEDTGVGIPEKDIARVFERFYRVDKARSRELGGTGLGLSIVKHLVQALGGTVTAASVLGQGSVFTVHLPLESSLALASNP